jgi:hypothetical protein
VDAWLQLPQRRNLVGSEDRRRVGPVDDPFQIRLRDIIGIPANDLKREIPVAQAPPRG